MYAENTIERGFPSKFIDSFSMSVTSHRIFRISELVHAIVEVVAKNGQNDDDDENKDEDGDEEDEGEDEDIEGRQPSHFTHMSEDAYRDVTSLGLTSKIFREATLSAIWDTQYSLIPLFRSVGLVKQLPSILLLEASDDVEIFVRFA